MYAIGIDLGGTSAKLALVDEDAGIIERRNALWERRTAADDIVRPLVRSIRELRETRADLDDEIAGVGLSTPGFLNSERTAILFASNLHMLEGVPLVEILRSETGKQVIMETDVNAGGLAEGLKGAGREFGRVLYVSIGTGLGASLIVNGRPVRTTRHGIGHLGHITLDPDGEVCGCGNRGCIETIVSSVGIERIAEKTLASFPNSVLLDRKQENGALHAVDIYRAAMEDHDEAALNILREEGEWLGLALYDFCPIAAPDVIVIGGGISEAGDFLLDHARQVLKQRLNPRLYGTVRVLQSRFGREAGVIGNALNILNR